MFYVEPTPPERRREGFLVAQRGQVLAADDATQDRLPPNATDADWPVSRLCQQLRISMEELALGFVDGPRVEVSLVEPAVDDQAVLMVLLGRDGEALPGNGGAPPKPAAAAPGKAPAPAPTKPGMNMAEDSKRRAIEQAAEQEAQKKRAAEVRSGLQYALDDLGLVVAPKADLSEPDILAPFVVSVLEGDAPHGVPSHLLDGLQRRRIDVAVRVEFLSEVFIETVPLNRGLFEERAETIDIGGRPLKRLEVLAPRLGYGTLVSTGKAHLYISRKLGMPVPEKLVLELLDS
jgi:hypothetical protein